GKPSREVRSSAMVFLAFKLFVFCSIVVIDWSDSSIRIKTIRSPWDKRYRFAEAKPITLRRKCLSCLNFNSWKLFVVLQLISQFRGVKKF
ncbi:MAG: hypothetical protein ACTSWK_04205, partial [Promethearchaeota archaeon]